MPCPTPRFQSLHVAWRWMERAGPQSNQAFGLPHFSRGRVGNLRIRGVDRFQGHIPGLLLGKFLVKYPTTHSRSSHAIEK